MLTHTTDYYDGVTIDETSLPHTIDEFKSVMESSLEEWRSTGKKGVWLKVRWPGILISSILGRGWEKIYESSKNNARSRAPACPVTLLLPVLPGTE